MGRGEDVLLKRAGGEITGDFGVDARRFAALDTVLCDRMSVECNDRGRERTAREASISSVFDAYMSSHGGRVNTGSMSDDFSYSYTTFSNHLQSGNWAIPSCPPICPNRISSSLSFKPFIYVPFGV